MRYQALWAIFSAVALFSLIRRSVQLPQLSFAHIGRNLTEAWEKPAYSSPVSTFNEDVSDIIAFRVLEFARLIAEQLGNEIDTSNATVFSPISIMSVLAMLLLGAKGNSYQELQRVLGLDADYQLLSTPKKFHTEMGYLLQDLQRNEHDGITRLRKNSNWRNTRARQSLRISREGKPLEHIIKVANGIFPQIGYTLNSDFVYILKNVYDSKLEVLDFATKPRESRDFINRWVEANTLGKIRNIINQQLSESNKVIIASALYFKGFWQEFFISSHEDDFYPDGMQHRPVRVTTMVNTGEFPYYESPEYDCQIIGLPYQDNETTMYIIQPNHSTRSRLKQMQRALNAAIIEELISKMTKRSASVTLPKMHLMRGMHLKAALSRLGIRDIFTQGVSDLSLIGGLSASQKDVVQPRLSREDLNNLHLDSLEQERMNPFSRKSDLFVDEIIHQVDIDINEQGTEAAAATVVLIMKTGPEVTFRVNSPFLFLIRHDPTKLILFYGIVNDPSS